jgi:S-DNA-T family DNA segregation ATPase FtsK/SpoIIIE
MLTTERCAACGEISSVFAGDGEISEGCRCNLSRLGEESGSSSILFSLTFEASPVAQAARGFGGAVVPERVGNYRLVRSIGAGGFGTVYEAFDEKLERRVALKIAHPAMMQDADLRARFIKEGRAAAGVRHNSIVVIYDADSDGAFYYIASEFLDGRTLKEVLAGGSLEVERAVGITIDLAKALAQAHAAGVVHRDVKPANVMITESGDVKLIDFGLARLDGPGQAHDVDHVGTPLYMSPEQAEGRSGEVGPASDQYSLGVVLYEMLAGKPPFRGDTRTVLHQLTRMPVPGLKEQGCNIPVDLETICLTALARWPVHRHPTCRDFASELEAWLQRRQREGGLGVASREPASGARQELSEPVAQTAGTVAPQPVDSDSDSAAAVPIRSRSAVHTLKRIAAERAAVEAQLEKRRGHRVSDARDEHDTRVEKARERLIKSRQKQQEIDDRERRQREEAAEVELAAVTARHNRRLSQIDNRADALMRAASERFEWMIAEANYLMEVKQAKARKRCQDAFDEIDREIHAVRALRERVSALAASYRDLGLDAPNFRPRVPRKPATLREVRQYLARAEKDVLDLESRPIARRWFGLGSPTGPSAAEIEPIYRRASSSIASARGFAQRVRELAAQGLNARLEELKALYNLAVARADDALRGRTEPLAKRRDALLARATELFEARCARIRAEAASPAAVARRLAELDLRYGDEVAQAEQALRDETDAADLEHRTDVDALADRWSQGVGEVVRSARSVSRQVGQINPPWDDPSWPNWTSRSSPPPVVRFGQVRIELEKAPGGVPRDQRMRALLADGLCWPAMLEFPERASLLADVPPAGREAAVRVVHSILMRLLTTLPAGQVRLTIVDPVGVGTDFGAFLHLEDQGLPVPIRTDAQQIEQSLGDLCGHVEKIIQSYLRDEHSTINEFNILAGEVAEPCRILVISDFPNGFNQVALKRLAQVIEHGPRCGILTLLVGDPSQTAPHAAILRRLADQGAHLVWRDGRLAWDDPDFGPFALEPDSPPPQALARQILTRVGAADALARRVEVPFAFVAPPDDRLWSADSRLGIEVGLGKGGPAKIQSLNLGRGTAQHVLIAGRTGSGKSSLLHALITNVALHYSPDEVELYLIDFKKGVEFKTYATHELPHAQVIAIESEREFGYSVLERLDAELKDRGERFRAAGVHDLKSYREIEGLPPLPRIMLVVDEFQEFFVEDDLIAREAALLLDRLVRQGRAFGVHVLLGSQSLAGAYSLARSTLEQMAVRIALQSGETDAHLILGEANGAARLLSRPGEAIYNDANGHADGNRFFQAVWLPDWQREEYLRRIRQEAVRRSWQPSRAQIVFEGDAAAQLGKNPHLEGRLTAPDWPATGRFATAWLGESIAIKGPTAASFRRQQGDHLLIVGHNGESAVGVMSSALLSLASQYRHEGPGSARFSILDGTPDDAPWSSLWARVAAVVPHDVRLGGRADASSMLAELAREIERRQEGKAVGGPDLFLFLADLGRFRALRRPDDFDVTATRVELSPPKALELILREGPPVGVFAVVWCDGLTSLNRAFNRATQHEFGAKVAFQMSSSDSVQLLESPLASRLGPHRAIFLDEQQGAQDKFRPYGLPSGEWLSWAGDRFRGREAVSSRGSAASVC